MPVGRDRKIRTALRTNQIVGFFAVPSEEKKNTHTHTHTHTHARTHAHTHTHTHTYIYIYKYYERKKDVTTFPDKPVS